jgi:uncharacterized SAM-binding protein YcdF (DUF218 family)
VRNEKIADRHARTIWDYMLMHQPLQEADLIFGPGSHDLRLAQQAAQLYLDGWAPLILFSGKEGHGKEISGFNGEPEAEVFADVATSMGVPESAILKEVHATNTGQNIIFSAELLAMRGIAINRMVATQKPYSERRIFATLKAMWPHPQPEFIVNSPPIPYQEYIANSVYPKDYMLSEMVGNLQRMQVYPALGLQIEQEIPDDVLDAYHKLIELGYTKRLLPL